MSWTAISPDGRLLATQRQAAGATDSSVEVRELPSGRPLYSRTVRFGIGEMQFSRDSRVLFASGCCEQGSTVIAWDARSGAERFERHPPGQAQALALAPDSRTLLVATQDGAVHTLDAHNGRERAPAIKVTSAAVFQLDVSPDGRLLATGDWAGHATLWDLRTHERLGDHFPKVPGVIPQVAFEPDGRLLITELGSASEWPVDRPTLQRFACRVAGRSLSPRRVARRAAQPALPARLPVRRPGRRSRPPSTAPSGTSAGPSTSASRRPPRRGVTRGTCAQEPYGFQGFRPVEGPERNDQESWCPRFESASRHSFRIRS